MFKDNWRFLLVYTAFFTLAWQCGFQPEIPYRYIQLLDQSWLTNRFWETMYNLHYQPPALNFMLGVLLWLQKTTGIRAETLMMGLNFALGLVTTASVASLSKSVIKDRVISTAVILLFLVNPYLYKSAFIYFYTYYELFLLTFTGVFVYSYFMAPRVRTYIYICVLLATVVYTHSLFHFLWPIPVLAGLPILAMKAPGLTARELKMTCAIGLMTVLVVLAWPAKNYFRFGYFTYSSLQGVNLLSKEVKVPFNMPPEFSNISAVSAPKKSDGTTNWNNYSIIPVSKDVQAMFFSVVDRNPEILFGRALKFYLKGYIIYEARSTWTGKLYTETPAIRLWMRAYELMLFQHFGEFNIEEYSLERGVVFTGFAFLFPLIMVLSMVCIFRSWGDMPAEARTAAFMLYCVAWVLIMSLLINGYESNRYRFPTEPYTMILAGWVVSVFGRSRARTAVLSALVLMLAGLGVVNWALYG